MKSGGFGLDVTQKTLVFLVGQGDIKTAACAALEGLQHSAQRGYIARQPAASVQLDEAPGAREGNWIVPRTEHHNNSAHFLDGAHEHLLPPALTSECVCSMKTPACAPEGRAVKSSVLARREQVQPNDGVQPVRL